MLAPKVLAIRRDTVLTHTYARIYTEHYKGAQAHHHQNIQSISTKFHRKKKCSPYLHRPY